MLKNKTMATVIALILVSSMAISLGALPTVSAAYDNATATAIAQGMTWGQNYNASATRLLLWSRFHDQIPTWVLLIAAPNPVGVGQPFNFVMFNPQVPPNSLLGNDIVYHYTIAVIKPDLTTETLPATGTFVSDSTGSQYTAYTPNQVGNYSFTVKFHELFYRWNATAAMRDYYGTTFKESTFTLKVVVQQEPVSIIGLPNLPPLPTEFWTRPIEGQNTDWYRVASNWLSGPHDRDNYAGSENRYQADGTAPNSPHILWTRPTEDNGVVGGNDLSRAGNVFNAGSQYQPRFTNQIIMYGRLYYSPNVYSSGSSALMDCVDLKTGKLLYEIDTKGANVAGLLGVSMTANMPQFGYYYSQDDPNEHGIQNPGWLFTSNYVIGYQPERGIPYLNIVNVPAAAFYGPGPASVFEIQVPTGENLRYVLTNQGTSSKPNYYLAQWNSSKVIPMLGAGSNPTNLPIYGNAPITPSPSGTNAYWNGSAWAPMNASIATVTRPSYDWNITMPIAFTTTPTIRAAKLGDILFGSNGTWPTGTSGPSYVYPQNVTLWAVSLNPASLGTLIYMKTIDVDTSDNQNIMIERSSVDGGVCVAIKVPTCTFIGYNIRTGDKLWETDAQVHVDAYGYFTWPSLISQTQTKIAYGMLYTAGYAGIVSAYNLTNGNLVWRRLYPSGGEKIQNFVQMLGLICDGKIYVGTHEHSADTPLYKGERLHCLNATTGEEIWTMSGWAYPMTFATADGVLIYWNNYDAQIYAVGKGPSTTTVEAPMAGVTLGSSLVIRGRVIDISAGTKQEEQAARFPDGVPAVSDASMGQWMEYVYMQKGRPSNATGVEVTLDAVDPNSNFIHIGTVTSDSSGLYSYMWKPDIPGKFTVIATFAGSESYYASYSETAIGVDEAPPAPPTPTPAAPLPPYEMYTIGAAIAIIIAVAIATILILRKRP
jgi:outer membrane protein assembly factor BamB